MAVVNDKRRQPNRLVRIWLLNLGTFDFQARSAIQGASPAINAGDAVPDNNPNLRTMLLRGHAVATQ